MYQVSPLECRLGAFTISSGDNQPYRLTMGSADWSAVLYTCCIWKTRLSVLALMITASSFFPFWSVPLWKDMNVSVVSWLVLSGKPDSSKCGCDWRHSIYGRIKADLMPANGANALQWIAYTWVLCPRYMVNRLPSPTKHLRMTYSYNSYYMSREPFTINTLYLTKDISRIQHS